MWERSALKSFHIDPQMRDAVRELLESTARWIILSIGIVYLIWQTLTGIGEPRQLDKIVPLSSIILLTCGLTYGLVGRHFLVAQLTWQVGMAMSILAGVYFYQQSEYFYYFALLPLMAVVTSGWQLAVVSEVMVATLLWASGQNVFMPQYSELTQTMIVVIGALGALVGWASTRSLLTVTYWSLQHYEMTLQNMQKYQEQRIELLQTHEDLVHSNRELARLSERLKLMTQIAEEARRTKEEFVANVSHELRTPLNMIIGFSEVILQSPRVYGKRLPETLLADIGAIQRNSQHLVGLVNDVLSLSQIDSGHLNLGREWSSLQEIILEALEAVQILFDSKKLYLKTNFPTQKVNIFCDRVRIREVVLNLLSNAGRFTEQGGVLVHIEQDGKFAVVSVTDSGPGIAAHDQQRIFEPFQQINSSVVRKNSGTGLGLSISKRFVELHGGKMWLKSEMGQGTTFYFSLPLEIEAPEAAIPSNPARWISSYHQYRVRDRRSKAPVPVITPRYIILEETNKLQQFFNRFAADVEIIPTHSIAEAVQELERSPASALLVNLPQKPPELDINSGVLANIPIIHCWIPGEVEAARQLGVIDYLIKPVTRETLLQAVQKSGNIQTILIVDDSPEAVQLFARMLSASEVHYQILRAMGGQQALDVMRQRTVDVVLLDLVMPDISGFQVLQEMENDAALKDIPVIIVSSLDPVGRAIASNSLTVSRANGLSVQEILGCFQALDEALTPVGYSPTPPKNLPG